MDVGLSPGQQAILLLALILIATATLCDRIFAIDSCQLEVNLVLFILRSSFSFSSGSTRLLSTLGVISNVRGKQTLIILVIFVGLINWFCMQFCRFSECYRKCNQSIQRIGRIYKRSQENVQITHRCHSDDDDPRSNSS